MPSTGRGAEPDVPAAFAAALDDAASIRRSNLEDAFIELTGRKEGL